MKKATILAMEMNEHIYEKSKETLCLNDQQGEFLKNKAACFLCYLPANLVSSCQKHFTSFLCLVSRFSAPVTHPPHIKGKPVHHF